MTTVRMLLKLKRSNPANSFLFENAETEEGFMLRVPSGRLSDDPEYVCIELTFDSSGDLGRFILFLREAVRRAPDGRLSGNMIWAAWAEWNGVSSSLQMIEGIDRNEIHDYFRVAFDENEMSWRRLNGRPQWLWMGYELVSE